MTGKEAGAVEIGVAYHRAWTNGDLDSAAEHLAESVTCHAPSGTFNGRAAVRAFMEPFAASLTSSRLLAVHGQDNEAILMYDTASRAVQSAPGAELYRVQDGQIVEIHIIFDRLPFALARGDVR
ncbi:nuclear transport factor 2 family protein [Arthrobacter sp. AK01]|uniref:nuclear transport factor 2 family protein n=1 Tax=Micrococcaceae TaxID=1268 RepID=UPI001E439802|nr:MULTISPECIES: nuclear transport factor 2 family protein [Micrococcaceae]MCD4853769.1 nuclear transport factor 2 family protein [Arthrobacter sp. AK01]MCP1411131.1 ketosteroid isomerase-like protein [Paenarthrobacter sp. A20]